MLEKLVEHIVKGIVNDPAAVMVTSVESAEKAVIKVRVHVEDIARVIGSEGKTFRAIRAVVKLVSADQGREVVVDIAE